MRWNSPVHHSRNIQYQQLVSIFQPTHGVTFYKYEQTQSINIHHHGIHGDIINHLGAHYSTTHQHAPILNVAFFCHSVKGTHAICWPE